MKMLWKKIIAIVCVMAMVVSTMSIQPKTINADEDVDPSQITEWKAVENSTELYYYIVNLPENVTTKPKIQNDNELYIGYDLPAKFSLVKLDDVDLSPTDGAYVTLEADKLTDGIHKLVVVDRDGNNSLTIYIRLGESAEIVDGTELLKDTEFIEGQVSHWDQYTQGGAVFTNKGGGELDVSIPRYDTGDNYATQLVQKNISLIRGKWYVAQFTITSNMSRTFQLMIQSDGNNGGDWKEFLGEFIQVEAGETKTVQSQFQATKSAEANVLYGIMMGYVNETLCEAANVTISGVSLKVYNDEQQIAGTRSELLTSDKISVEGFQMKTNWKDTDDKEDIGFRTICKAPDVGGKVSVDDVSYTVARIGTIYSLEVDKNIPQGLVFNSSCTLLKSYTMDGANQGNDKYELLNYSPFTIAYAATEKGVLEKKDGYSSYVQTLVGTVGQLHPANKIHVRAFIVTTGGTIIYSTKSVSTSIARVAEYMYVNSLSTHHIGHEYLYDRILNLPEFVPEQNTGYIDTKANPYYRTEKVEYGWNGNLYQPDGEDHMVTN